MKLSVEQFIPISLQTSSILPVLKSCEHISLTRDCFLSLKSSPILEIQIFRYKGSRSPIWSRFRNTSSRYTGLPKSCLELITKTPLNLSFAAHQSHLVHRGQVSDES